MTNFSAAINYAIIMVNDQENKDYYDNFVPMIAECIRRSHNEVISINDIQNDLLVQFGIKIPINVINSILRRRLTKKGYIKYREKKYIPNREELSNLDFNQKQEIVLEQHDRLINELHKFSLERYQTTWAKDDAEAAFELYLKENKFLLLDLTNHRPLKYENSKQNILYIVGQFIKTLDQESTVFRYLEAIIKGDMLANAIYYTDPAHAGMKFQNSTEIYFDTSFLIYALGYCGEARQAPCIELINLLRESNAILRCFKHTITEIIGILEGCQYRLREGYLVDNHGTMEYFISKKYTATDIERLIFSLEKEIENKLRIRILEKPAFIVEFNIDERGLNDSLKSSIHYTKEQALERDVASISAIMRLRKNKSSIFVEDCRALFVTTNYSLAEVTKKHFLNELHSNRTIPPVLSDHVLTNLLWLKNPTSAPNLTRKRIIADCIAATMPQEHVWKRYFEKIEELNKAAQITIDDYFILRYSQEARAAMMEFTQGNEDAITIGTIEEILSASKAEIAKEYRIITELKEQEAKKIQEEFNGYLNQIAIDKEKRGNRVEEISSNLSKISLKILKALIVILLLIGQTFSFYMLGFKIPIWVHVPIVAIFISFFPVAGYMGLSLLKPFEKLENLLKQKIKMKLNSLFELQQNPI